MHEANVKIHLHCYQYDRQQSKELEKYCEKVYYYKRENKKRFLFHKYPYIIRSRKNEQLLENICRDDFPVLFEGLHTCYYLENIKLKNKTKVIRTYNVEHQYYKELANVERNVFRKYFFYNEAFRLRLFEKKLHHAHKILAISQSDQEYFFEKFGEKSEYIPCFHSCTNISSQEGIGKYALYHGNLQVGENNHAAMYLVTKVFDNLDYPLKIAGNSPSKNLKSEITKRKNVELIENPDEEQLKYLLRNAHVNVLPTFQNTGIKLKLIHSLFTGRHCIVNSDMIKNTGLEELCEFAEDVESFRSKILALKDTHFGTDEVKRRETILKNNFSNKLNAIKLLKVLFGANN